MIYFLTKQATLTRRSTVLSLPPLVSIPWFWSKTVVFVKKICHHNSETFKYFADAAIVSNMVMGSQYDARQYKIYIRLNYFYLKISLKVYFVNGNATKLSITTLSIMTFSMMTLSIMTLSIMTLSKTTFSIMTLSIMTLSITSFYRFIV